MTTPLKKLKFELKKFVKRRLNHGDRYSCPICDSHLSSMLAHGHDSPIFKKYSVVGGGYRANAACPVCGCVDRERLIYLYLRECAKIHEKPLSVLHLAPEPGIERKLERMRNLDYLTADFLEPHVMVKMDITDIQYPDNSFDVIICNHVLEHVPEDVRGMSEMHRVLRPGGWATLQVPISFDLPNTLEDWSLETEEERYQAFGQRDHVRLYGMDYVDRLKQGGFEVDIFEWTKMREKFGGAENIYNLNESEKLFIGRKRE